MSEPSNLHGENAQICVVKPPREGVFTHPLHLALSRPTGPRDMRPWIIRPMTFADTYQAAFIASRAYHDEKFTEFLSPGRRQYPEDYVRGFQQRIMSRLLQANSRGFVAVAEDEPDVPVAYVQCERLGDDEGAKAVIGEKKSLWLSICQLVYAAWIKVSTRIWPDRSGMEEHDLAIYMESTAGEDRKHWSSRPERANRWYTRSMVVSQEFQRRGLGRALMNEVIVLAERQEVPIQLEASPEGEWLYRSLGFELLDRFMIAFGEAERDQGGVMIYRPLKQRIGSVLVQQVDRDATGKDGETASLDTEATVVEGVDAETLKEDLKIEPQVVEVPADL